MAGSLRAAADLPRYFLVGDRPTDALANTAIALRRWPETLIYHMSMGRVPNYVNPRLYTEKVQWRKLFDRRPLLPLLCDKLAAKEFALLRAPDVSVPETLWTGTDPEAVPFDELEPPYVVKANNRSSAIVFVETEEDLDREATRAACRRWMSKRAHKSLLYEWGYGRVESKLLVERFLPRGDESGSPPDLKVFVFDGRPAYLYVRDPVTDSKTVWDAEGRRMPWDRWTGLPVRKPERFGGLEHPPAGFADVMDAAGRIAAGFDHLRVDLYYLEGRVYFGEMTVYASSGHKPWYPNDARLDPFPPDDVDRATGAEWQLPVLARRTVLWRGLVGRNKPEPGPAVP